MNRTEFAHNPKGGQREEAMTKRMSDEVAVMVRDGMTNTAILSYLQIKYEGYSPSKYMIYKVRNDLKTFELSRMPIQKAEEYVKESLYEYDRILEGAKEIESATSKTGKYMISLEAQRNQLASLKDRNAMLGLDKENPTMVLNFNSNIDEVELIKSLSKPGTPPKVFSSDSGINP